MVTPIRSISLPSRLHSDSCSVEEHLNKLRAWEALLSSASSLEAEMIEVGLVGLAELYVCVEEVLISPSVVQALLHIDGGKLVEEALDGSVGVLDSCNVTRDMISRLKECVRDLQSVLRRKGGCFGIEGSVNAYFALRKMAKKEIERSLRVLKKMENKFDVVPSLDANRDQVGVVKVLKEVNEITSTVFQCLLAFLSMPMMKTKANGWRTISRLLSIGSATPSKGQKIITEVGNVDIVMYSLQGYGKGDHAKVNLQIVQERLRTLEATVQSIENELDCVYRHLVQSRVSFLNILTN